VKYFACVEKSNAERSSSNMAARLSPAAFEATGELVCLSTALTLKARNGQSALEMQTEQEYACESSWNRMTNSWGRDLEIFSQVGVKMMQSQSEEWKDKVGKTS
jgi:hypothetical protein